MGYQNGPVESARFNAPSALVVAGDGTVFVADSGNGRIRRISGGQVSTYGGSASFASPRGLAWEEATKTLYVADYGAGRIQTITPAGQVSTLVSELAGPLKLAWESDAPLVLLVSEYDGHRVRRVDVAAKTSTILVGDGTPGLVDGTAASARLRQPAGLAVTSDGKVWIADTGNHALRLLDSDQVSTLVGAAGLAGDDDGPVATARLTAPYALLLTNQTLVVADSGAHRLRRVTP